MKTTDTNEVSNTPRVEWRELGHDEVIQKGDEYCSHSYVKWRPVDDDLHNTMVKQWSWNWYRFRTRRPLPMSNETDTPRTDAAYKDHEWDLMDHIPLEFARQLERELNESQAQSHGLARRVVEAETKLEVVQRQLKRAVEIADDLMICSPIGVRSLWNEAVEKLFSLKEEIK